MDPLTIGLVGAMLWAMAARSSPPTFDRHPVSDTSGNVIGSRYGARVDPITGAPGAHHNGQDYRVPSGTQCLSIGHGAVAWVDRSTHTPSGRNVGVRGEGAHTGWEWSYSHLSSIDVTPGQVLEPGAVVGTSGDSGMRLVDGALRPSVTGPHLHFVLRRWTAQGERETVDPLAFLPATGAVA